MGRVEKPELPELPDRTKFGGYTIFRNEDYTGFVVWSDDGPVSSSFGTKEEAIAWIVKNPKNNPLS